MVYLRQPLNGNAMLKNKFFTFIFNIFVKAITCKAQNSNSGRNDQDPNISDQKFQNQLRDVDDSGNQNKPNKNMGRAPVRERTATSVISSHYFFTFHMTTTVLSATRQRRI